jgi:hypothetical protein
MASYFNYKIQEFVIESLDGTKSIDATTCVSSIKYFEDIFSPAVFISMVIVNTDGLISSLPIRGGERIRLIITQEATGQRIELSETKNPYYIHRVHGSTSQSTREMFLVELAPIEVFKNETTRVFNRYPKSQGGEQKISDSIDQILKDVLKTDKKREIEPTKNSYAFYGNSKKPFNILSWLCPKSIPPIGKSSPTEGTAGYLFYENKNGYNFRSVDSLMSALLPASADQKQYQTYSYSENVTDYARDTTNFKVLTVPTFEKNVNVLDNLRIGMYSSVNYFFDLNTKKFDSYKYKLSESYDIMNHASKSKERPQIPEGLEDSPSRLMVKFIDGVVKSPGNVDPTSKIDDRIKYQSQSVARYNLAFSQSLSITVPLNLNLAVGDVIRLNIGKITKQEKEKDDQKSGLYLIKELAHDFSDIKGLTGLKLVRDSYGEP